MKRAMSIVAAFLLLLATLATPTAQPGHAQAEPSQTTTVIVDDPPRHTPISRAVRTQAHQTHLVQPGDTYGAMAKTHCGQFNMWPGIQAANKWPERAIPVGKTASIVCTRAATLPARQPAPAAAAPKTVGTPWVHPLASGARGNNPNCWHTSQRPSHEGVDIAQPKGTPIRAVAAGTIYRRAFQAKAGYYVTINHGGGTFTQYHHMTGHTPLAQGAHVNVGQTIGYVGITGNASGYHLHFEVMVGGYDRNTNPSAFMRQRGVNIGC